MNVSAAYRLALAIVLACGVSTPARAATPTTPYPRMAPLARYMSGNASAEVALARSAAPASISHEATVLVLARAGYRTAVHGSNGFTCLVERSWTSPFDSADFWNPKLRGPICYNPPAVRTVLPYTLARTTLALAGLSKGKMRARIVASLASHALRPPEAGAMSYMMSKEQYLGDGVGRWYPHLMFAAPKSSAATWGADLAGSPVMYDDEHHDMPEPESIFMVAVSHWSDGERSPARK